MSLTVRTREQMAYELLLIAQTIMVITFILTTVGILTVYSASSLRAVDLFNSHQFYLRKQLIFALLSSLVTYIILRIPLSFFSKNTLWLLVFSILGLSLVFVPGFSRKIGGATRWLKFGGWTFQPSEFAKLALLFFLAKSLSRNSSNISGFNLSLLSNLFVVGIFAMLLMLQPDFGTTVLIGTVTFVLLYVAGLRLWVIFTAFSLGVVFIISSIFLTPYRLERLLSFLNPWEQIHRGGFQIIQSYLAYHNGGFFGVGLGESRQKLHFLPEAHTDFILAIIGEELGLIGVAFIWLLFLLLCWCGFRLTHLQEKPFNKFLCFGITLTLTLQAMINMAVTIGLLPTKGIPLPFISSGISSLMIYILMTGILVKIALKERQCLMISQKTQ